MTTRWRTLFLLVVLALVPVRMAEAQAEEASASMSAAARDLYQQGVTAAQAGQLDEAIAAFERSYALSARDATLLNLAQVQERAGHLVAALDSYRRFVARADPDMIARYGERARAAAAALEPRLAHVTIVAFDVEADAEVLLDGTVLAPESLGVALPVDPGSHVVLIRRGEAECAREPATLAEGTRRDVELRATCPAPAIDLGLAALPAEPAPAQPDDSALWIGLGVGGGVLVVTAAIVLAVVLSAPADGPMPFVGNVGAGSYVAP